MERGKAGNLGYIAGRWPLDPARSTIVFIHGAGGTSVLWHSQVEALAERVNTVAVDLPGHGRSSGSGKRKVEDYTRAVIEFLDRIGAPGLIPCGLSMGGAVAQQLLLDRQDRFRAGILVSTGARLKVMPAILETIEKDYGVFIQMLGTYAVSEKTDPELLRPLIEEIARCKPETALGDFRACNAFNVMERLPSIQVPVLVVTAADDKLTPPKYGDSLEKGIPNAHRVHIEDAGHLVPMEKPDEVNKAILAFLDQNGL
jgi:pimeloyl-ACP methyl ester carboxylesterase